MKSIIEEANRQQLQFKISFNGSHDQYFQRIYREANDIQRTGNNLKEFDFEQN